ncbi:FxSxx-COOH system tetratricopeptide repeat protein [Streptomyces fumanus]|uniref:FxSxx-COOH system tetratricopeptide repeat protein n=2 Tax=Streptomyces fumanus TaxID=67302 RepID=UPI001E3D9A28|nr:FxSxx-COOH system tetratricopeptide repeat protein [Streptomyces fumanus]
MRPGRAEPAPPRPRPGTGTVTISFAGPDRAWAAWIGDRLRRRGVRVDRRRWDPPAGVPLAGLLSGLRTAGPVLMVLSAPYFEAGGRTRDEWERALRDIAAADPSGFAAVSVTSVPVPAATAALRPVDLTALGAEEAERRLLARLDLPADPLPERVDDVRYPASRPDVWGLVPRHNPRFTGREALLAAAHRLLRDAGRVTLHGMSGVGKTQMATEYVYRFGPEYDVVWWVHAESRATCRRRLAELAPALGLRTGEEYGMRVRAVRDALRRGEPYSRWLLVLDGADEPDQIHDLLPAGPGHVLVTSRNPDWAEHGSELLEVPVYTREESVAFVRRRAPRLSGPEADQLAEALGDLPLLLDQTAGWLDESDLPVGEYLALLEAGTADDVLRVSADFPLAYRTAWTILLESLRAAVPESVDLLRLCTFFAPGHVPVHLLRKLPREGLPPSVARLLTDPALWAAAVDQLRRYSVVRVEPHEADPAREVLYLHRVVHGFVRAELPEDTARELADVVRRALAAADPGKPSSPALWPAYAEIVPHLKHAQVLASEDPGVQRLVLNCLRYLYLSGEYAAGGKLGGRAMDAWRALLGESHPRIWELTYHYANLLRAVGDYDRTMRIERAAADHLRRQRGERDPAYLRALGGLAADLRGLGRYAEALEMSERVLTAYRERLGEDDTATVNARNNVAVSLRLLGRYEDACRLNSATLAARRALLGDRHPWTLNSEHAYALDLRLLGRYGEATAVQEPSLRVVRETLGPDTVQALRAQHNLAMCRYAARDLDDAGRYFADALERAVHILGDRDPLTLILAVGQSCFAREHGDAERARALSAAVVAAYEETLSPDHPYAVGARANHALALHRAGDPRGALELARAARAGMAARLGPGHPWTLGCALNEAALRAVAGDTERAAALSRDTADRAARVLGPAHPFTGSALRGLAADLRALGRADEADRARERALDEAGHGGPARRYWDFEPHRT